MKLFWETARFITAKGKAKIKRRSNDGKLILDTGTGIETDEIELNRPQSNSTEATASATPTDDKRSEDQVIENLEKWLGEQAQKLDRLNTDDEIAVELSISAEEFRKFFIINKNKFKYANWREIAGNSAWADTFWQFGDSLAVGITNIEGSHYLDGINGAQILGSQMAITACAWPIFLGIAIMAKYYRDAIKHIEKEYQRPPTTEEIAKIREDTMMLGVKIFTSVLGWELGYYIALHICQAIGQAAITANGIINPLGHLIMAAVIGVATAFTICTLNLIYYGLKGANSPMTAKEVAWDTLKLFVCALVGGAFWYGISAIPFGNNWAGVLSGTVVKSLMNYMTIKLVFFDLYKVMDGFEAKDQPYTKPSETAETSDYMLTHNAMSLVKAGRAVWEKLPTCSTSAKATDDATFPLIAKDDSAEGEGVAGGAADEGEGVPTVSTHRAAH